MRKNHGLVFAAFFIAQFFTTTAAGSERLGALGHFNKYPSAQYNDCWGYTAPDGREYALLGVRNGTSVIDITDAPELREIAFIPSQNSIWKDIKTYQHYAYVVNESGNGLQIIDLGNLPHSATLVKQVPLFRTSHNISIDVENAILYAEGEMDIGVRVISLADPLNPVQTSTLIQETHDILGQNGIAYVSEGGSGSIGIYDMHDIRAPKLMKRIRVPNPGYVHNAWPTADGRYLMSTEETEGKTLKMWDLTNLADVHMIGEYLAPSGLTHNTHIKGRYAYISHYGSGLRIVDIADPAHPTEVAMFDRDDQDDESYTGAWGAYPFFASGKLLMSDIEQGLFVVPFEGARGE